uniref:OmpA family protein n=1 Tax=Bradyrhizobium sp. (strain ORS 278) TaxID=114615 RepID=UPI0002E345F9|nr:OmpA family protein [Bradyrhizobium sp. ORS 278]
MQISKVFGIALVTGVAMWSMTPPALADLGFPDTVKFPGQIVIDAQQQLIKENLAEDEFASDATGTMTVRRGRHFQRWMTYKPAAGEPAPGYYNGTEERIFKAMQAPLLAAGWQLVQVNDNKDQFTMHLVRGGTDAWLAVKMDGPQAAVNVNVIESGEAAPALTLAPPAAKPEKVADKDDLPYLKPYPGSSRKGEGRGNGPLDVTRPGSGDEPALVGQGVVVRSYQGPTTLSKLQFVAEYRAALSKAGWQVTYPATDKEAADAAVVIAHYTRDGRDIWARLTYEFGANLSVSVVDLGAEDLAGKLDKDCHLPLYGVLFDFNKASLKPESEPLLTKVAALVTARPDLNAEIEGHTDNVGGDDYNMRLSDARAASVRTWLTQHGVAAARLTSHGYGKTRPVADNGTDQGRALNRRVEIVKLGCRR